MMPKNRATRSFGLGTLMLFVGIACVFAARYRTSKENRDLRAFILRQKALLGEVCVNNENKLAIAAVPTVLSDERRWNVHIPPGDFELLMASDVVGKSNFPQPSHRMPIKPGLNHIHLYRNSDDSWSYLWSIGCSVNEEELEPHITFPKSKDRSGRFRWQLVLQKPAASNTREVAGSRLEVFRQIFNDDLSGVKSSARRGLLIWIRAK